MLDTVYTFIPIRKNARCGDPISYSPSKQRTLIPCVDSIGKYSFLILDLITGDIDNYIENENWTDVLYSYWLSETEIAVFLQDGKNEAYYHLSISIEPEFGNVWTDRTKNDPEARERCTPTFETRKFASIPFYSGSFGSIVDGCYSNSCIIKVQDHQFLLVKASTYLLCHICRDNNACLPPFELNITLPTDIHIIENYFVRKENMFAFNNMIYFFLEDDDNKIMLDRFVQISVDNLNFLTRKAEFTFDIANVDIFCPEKLTAGAYDPYRGVTKWQEDEMVLFTRKEFCLINRMWITNIWILNLEKKSVSVHYLENEEFTKATLFRGFLQLWNTVTDYEDDEILVYKYVFLKDHVPTLKDLCTANLYSNTDIGLKHYDYLKTISIPI